MTGDQQGSESGTLRFQLGVKIRSTLTRHHHVRQKKVNGLIGFPKQLLCLLGRTRTNNPIPLGLKPLVDHLSDRRFTSTTKITSPGAGAPLLNPMLTDSLDLWLASRS